MRAEGEYAASAMNTPTDTASMLRPHGSSAPLKIGTVSTATIDAVLCVKKP